MTESNDNSARKVHLIKGAKPAAQEPQPEQPVHQEPAESSAEKKKVVVVVKKKVVAAKKVQPKVVSSTHEAEQQHIIAEEQEYAPAVQHPSVTQQAVAQEQESAPKEAAAPVSSQEKAPSPASTATSAEHAAPVSKPSPAPARDISGESGSKHVASQRPVASHGSGQAPSQAGGSRSSDRRPSSEYPSERRYSSDGRAGNLAQGRPGAGSQRGGYGDRGQRASSSGYQGQNYGNQGYQGRSTSQGQQGGGYPSQGRAGRVGPQNYGQRPGQGSAGPGRPAPRPGQGAYPPRPVGPGSARPGAPGSFGGRPSPVPPAAPANRMPARRQALGKKKNAFNKHEEEQELEKQIQLKKKAEAKLAAVPKSIDIMENITVADLARKMNLKPADLIGKLMSLGVMATINQKIDADTAAILASEYGCEVHVVSLYDETVIEKEADRPEDLMPRPPIVTVMGHVDHGKTKLLDAIRKTDVVSQEFGGITQHIGAYMVDTPHGKITFLDTPGHAAFTKMRARGANLTDIVVLVVSAVEGVMPQTKEAIDHAKAAEVPIIVAINKIDLPEANPDRVKTQLSELGLIPEEWGGTTQFCEVSALQKKGIPELFDAILLQAELLDLKANYNRNAEGKVIESRIDQGRGIVSTVMVQNGVLRIGDPFVAGIFPGKVRALFNDKGQRIEEATPSMPVEVLGFEGMPEAGDPFEVVEDEKFARSVSAKRQELKKYEEGRNVKKVTLDNLYETISAGEMKELKVIIKGDVHGSVEALKGMLEKLSTPEVRLTVIRAAAGAITEDDVMMASASNAIIIGFNVRPTASAKQLAEREKVDIRKYNIIYRAQEEIKKAMEGLLAPELKEEEVGKAEVRNIFRVPKVGIVAGCIVTEGVVKRSCQVRVIRDNIEIFQGSLASLKRFKDDVKEVAAGYECGIGIENCNDLQEGDMLEFYETIEVARSLDSGSNNGSNPSQAT
ncbi:MAG: translation initiation factor IF-2 [Spirochaetaceae bacterium]|nr:translation initiation factor IF-2 [Spirochaetaceae bacterium]